MTPLVRSSRKVIVYLFMLAMMLTLQIVLQPSLGSPGVPVADFKYLPGTPVVGETVTFDASLSTPNGGTIESYIWSFGDGTLVVIETDPVTTHQYAEEGIYSVSLVVVDSEAEIDSTTKNVTVGLPVSSLLVFAEAASFVRVDDIDPSGWFYQAVLYNPTNVTIVVTGLRWWFNSSEKLIDSVRAVRCYDSRYFLGLPTTSGTGAQIPSWAKWEYPADSVSVPVPAGEIVVTWIEVPTKSNNGGLSMSATYYVEAYDGNQWVSSTLYSTHGGNDHAVSTVFRADFNLATDPNDENQTHTNPQWLFNEDRATNPEATVRVRLIPIASSRNAISIDYATINIMFPSEWSYVLGSAYNPYGETITYLIGEKDRLKWDLNKDVYIYSNNQSMAQNYIEFNATTSSAPGIYNFTINASVTSNDPTTTAENQFIYVVVKSPPIASFTYSPEISIVNETVTLNAMLSYDPDGNITSYYWDFGDGNNGTDIITTHNYTTTGTYNVTLTVADNDNLTDSESTLIIVKKYPKAAFTYSPTVPLINQTVTFNASLSTPEGGTITSYNWNFGDETNVNETDPVTYHNCTIHGTYNVTLNITDSEGLWDIETKTITVINYPTASFTLSPENPLVGETITFNASLSTPNGGAIIDYIWDFGDGTNETGVIATHAYMATGNYNVTLTITDSEGLSDAGNKSVIVQMAPVYIHDIRILNVIPSATEVDLDQGVNITVIVRNEGNFTETFDVTLYYDNNTIETQTVTNLAPSADKTLTFRWNTAGVTPNTNYTIKAEASTVQGETDTDNNTNADVTIKVKSEATFQPFDWAPILNYILPISLGSIFFLVAGVIWKKRSPTAAGFEFFDEITGGGIPDRYSTMIIGDANSGKSVFCQQLVHTYLSKEKPCIYINYDSFPDEVRENMKNFNWSTSTYEQQGIFKFVDCYSPTADVASKEENFVEQPFSLSDLGIVISKAMHKAKQESPKIFLDSTAPLFTRLEPSTVVEFLQDRSARVKGSHGAFFFTIGKGTVPPDLMSKLEEVIDCIIQLHVQEVKGKITTRLRIKKLRGRRFVDSWITFEIKSKRGLVLFPPKGWSKSTK
jgi:PKD repeat protein